MKIEHKFEIKFNEYSYIEDDDYYEALDEYEAKILAQDDFRMEQDMQVIRIELIRTDKFHVWYSYWDTRELHCLIWAMSEEDAIIEFDLNHKDSLHKEFDILTVKDLGPDNGKYMRDIEAAGQMSFDFTAALAA